GGQDQGSGDDQGSPHVLPRDLLVVVQGVGVHHHLEVLKAGAVVELDEGEGLHVPDGAGQPHTVTVWPSSSWPSAYSAAILYLSISFHLRFQNRQICTE